MDVGMSRLYNQEFNDLKKDNKKSSIIAWVSLIFSITGIIISLVK